MRAVESTFGGFTGDRDFLDDLGCGFAEYENYIKLVASALSSGKKALSARWQLAVTLYTIVRRADSK
jgi:hypothetical protein